ncbi:uncharacterized protein [Nicotiana sylvestris]|uniref:uncharacterized protein n=1 Tax=Nicotiana sylvestris TaxID=4096 RepID=UPI00388C8D6E
MQAEDKVIPKAHTLSGFDNSSVVTKGEVILTAFATGVVKETKFQVVDMEMAYNMIMGIPWIHDMDDVLSTLHQVIKFPSLWEICQIRGDQQTARSVNAVTDLDSRPDIIQELEENESIKTTIEELETVILFEQWPERKVYVGANLSSDMRDKGTYCYKVMPFGLKNAGATYQRLVTKMFQEHLGKTMEVYRRYARQNPAVS